MSDSSVSWSERARSALQLYRESLLRQVALKLIRPRSQYTADELRERMCAALDDPVGIDRTLKSVSPIARQLLKLIDISHQCHWRVQLLADLLPILGHRDGIGPIQELIEAGLLFPDLVAELPFESVANWLAQANFDPISVFTVPLIATRCRAEILEFDAPAGEKSKLSSQEADGLEWPLRLAVMWQTIREGPLRQTLNGGLFKRDQDRLGGHAILAAHPADCPTPAEDPALMVAALARALGICQPRQDEWVAGSLPASWTNDIHAAIPEIWAALNGLTTWDPLRGYDPDLMTRKWLPTLSVALAAALKEATTANWHPVRSLADWLAGRQPDASREIGDLTAWCGRYILGVWFPLKLVEIAKGESDHYVRLSTFGRQLFSGEKLGVLTPPITQTLLVQPNLEVIVYRQGLTPTLISHLTRFAEWKSLGLACTLHLTPESVYRGLESGLALSEIQRLLERHSTRPLSESVIETMRSWASRRERVQVFPSAVLLEFRTAADLDAGIKSGLVEQRLTERIGIVSAESKIDYSGFRLIGSRDYLDPEERCVETENDGMTLVVSDGKADLLLATELRRFADAVDSTLDERSRYRISIASLQRAKENGIDLRWLEDWFHRRSGFAIPATTKILFQGKSAGELSIQTVQLLRTPSAEVADGIERWSAADGTLVERIGPTTFIVQSDMVADLRRILIEAGLNCT